MTLSEAFAARADLAAPEQSESLTPVGEVQHLHELNDDWVKLLPIGTKLYSERDVNDFINAQVAAQTMEASCLNNVIVSLEAEIATIKAATPEQSYGWLIACDEELVCAHLGVAELSHSYAYAKAKLMELIDWHIAVATDPAVNGGLSLQPTTPGPVNQMLLAALKGLLPSLLRRSAAMEKSDWDSVWIAHAAIAEADQAPQPTELTDDVVRKARGALHEMPLPVSTDWQAAAADVCQAVLAAAIKAKQDYTRAVISERDALIELNWKQGEAFALAKQERDEYQRCADKMAAEHKVERDALMSANQDCLLHFDTLKADYDRLRKVAQQALEWFEWLHMTHGSIQPPHLAMDVQKALRKELGQ